MEREERGRVCRGRGVSRKKREERGRVCCWRSVAYTPSLLPLLSQHTRPLSSLTPSLLSQAAKQKAENEVAELRMYLDSEGEEEAAKKKTEEEEVSPPLTPSLTYSPVTLLPQHTRPLSSLFFSDTPLPRHTHPLSSLSFRDIHALSPPSRPLSSLRQRHAHPLSSLFFRDTPLPRHTRPFSSLSFRDIHALSPPSRPLSSLRQRRMQSLRNCNSTLNGTSSPSFLPCVVGEEGISSSSTHTMKLWISRDCCPKMVADDHVCFNKAYASSSTLST